jgi:hypothetical protein
VLQVIIDAERIERLLSEGMVAPDQRTDYQLATPAERRKARDATAI